MFRGYVSCLGMVTSTFSISYFNQEAFVILANCNSPFIFDMHMQQLELQYLFLSLSNVVSFVNKNALCHFGISTNFQSLRVIVSSRD